MNNENLYGCPGCGMEVTEEQFEQGQTTCDHETCERFGEPLEKMQYCVSCEEYFTSDTAEEHTECG